MKRYTIEQKYFCVEKLMKKIPSRKVGPLFQEKFQQDPPESSTMVKWKKKLKSTGSLNDRPKSGRKTTSIEKIEEIKSIFDNDNKMSVRKAASIVTLSKTTVHRIIRKELKLNRKN